MCLYCVAVRGERFLFVFIEFNVHFLWEYRSEVSRSRALYETGKLGKFSIIMVFETIRRISRILSFGSPTFRSYGKNVKCICIL